MLKRLIVIPVILLIASSPAITTMAQEATPESDVAIERHLAWVLGLFANGADDLNVTEVEDHFDEIFLGVVPADEFVASIQQLERSLGALELVDDQSSSAGPGEFSGLFRSASGELVVVSFAVDPETGLMSGFFITPGRGGPASPVATPAGSPAATPEASPVARGPVQAGDQIGLTGNFVNTSEPHIHMHVQDSPELLDFNATGIPLRFSEIVVDGEPVEDALPVQGGFVAPE